ALAPLRPRACIKSEKIGLRRFELSERTFGVLNLGRVNWGLLGDLFWRTVVGRDSTDEATGWRVDDSGSNAHLLGVAGFASDGDRSLAQPPVLQSIACASRTAIPQCDG
uniref:DNA for 9 kD component of photosystem II n=1 Tax=Leptolyngbya laminosa TaxID=477181 RepID=Q51874_LEPLM|nr:unnamed protein product [Phormidium laminosum]